MSTKAYEYRIRQPDGTPSRWLVVITPGDSMEVARAACEHHFGDRLLEIRPMGYQKPEKPSQGILGGVT